MTRSAATGPATEAAVQPDPPPVAPGPGTAAGGDPAPAPAPTGLRAQSKILVVLFAAITFQLALVAAFTGAMGRPSLHSAKVGLVVTAHTPAADAVASHPIKGVSYRDRASAAEARTAVRNGALPAAIVIDNGRETVFVASASGPALAAGLSPALAAQAKQAGLAFTAQDVRPLPPRDPKGLGTFLLVIGWVIGGYVGMTLLSRAVGAGARTPRGTATLLGWTAVYAVLSAVAGVVLVDPLMGVVTGAAGPLIAAGTLIVFAVAALTAALMSLLGLSGLVVAIASLVILGNPTSGGSVPVPMLGGGWRFLAEILPTHAGVSLTRALAYFDGHQKGTPILVLGIYAAASVLLMVGLSLRRRNAPAADRSVPAQPAGPPSRRVTAPQ
ncbi:MAG: hypothetical protein ACQSGP_03715 [Frankia sp.]